MKKLIKSPITRPLRPNYWYISEDASVNFNTAFQDVVDSYFNPTQGVETNDFELNKNLLQFIFEGYNLGNIKLIYLQYESPTNYNFSELDILKNGDGDSLYNVAKEKCLNFFREEKDAQGATYRALTLTALAQTLGVLDDFMDEPLPPSFTKANEKVNIVLYKPMGYSRIKASVPNTPLWAMTHEIIHTVLNSTDEQVVQRKTFDTLYELGFYDDYITSFFGLISSRQDNPYNIFDYVVDTLRVKDAALLNDMLNTCYYALADLRDSVDKKYQNQLQGYIDRILTLLNDNLDTPDGLEGILY